ncbi:hypothetical protein [Bradyrhizobium frederickii]|uniref:hypothetical protein n=1 Tax=Bradyrhizobium frederickii TaxID=2560054 RepID=UPI001F2E5FB8|nr:hypothetical protein [Bradyrhizobium frederickii]
MGRTASTHEDWLAQSKIALCKCRLLTERDSIFEVIEHHRKLRAQVDAAASISAKLVEGPEFDAADAISEQKRLALEEYADVLIHSKPTALAGVIALNRCVARLPAWQLSDDYDWH